MKKLFLFLTIFFLVVSFAHAVRLEWEPSPSPSVTGYAVYYGKGVDSLTYVKDVGPTLTAEITGLDVGTWYFGVTAYNQVAESELSNIVSDDIVQFEIVENLHIPVERPASININITVE